MIWAVVIGVVVFLLAYRLLRFHLAKRFLDRFLMDYESYLSDGGPNLWALAERKSKLKQLLEESGVTKPRISYMEPGGYGYLKQIAVDVIDNLLVKNEEICSNVQQVVHESLGYYRDRRNETINPLFWVDFIIRLPKYLLQFFAWEPPGSVYKFFQLLYWLAMLAWVFVELRSRF